MSRSLSKIFGTAFSQYATLNDNDYWMAGGGTGDYTTAVNGDNGGGGSYNVPVKQNTGSGGTASKVNNEQGTAGSSGPILLCVASTTMACLNNQYINETEAICQSCPEFSTSIAANQGLEIVNVTLDLKLRHQHLQGHALTQPCKQDVCLKAAICCCTLDQEEHLKTLW